MVADRASVRAWLVERTFSEDKPNLIILVYATTDGDRYFRKERAVTGLSEAHVTTAAVDLDPDELDEVDDEAVQNQYATEATRMANVHEPDDPI